MPGKDRNSARHNSAAAKGDPAAGRECWQWSAHSPQAAGESLAKPLWPPSHHWECFTDSLLHASLKIEEAAIRTTDSPPPRCLRLLLLTGLLTAAGLKRFLDGHLQIFASR